MPLGRTYKLDLEIGPYGAPAANGIPYQQATQHLTIEPPFTIEFDIRRNFAATAQTGTFTVSQLGEKTRQAIYHDEFAVYQLAAIQFYAGYVNAYMPQIFNGKIFYAYPIRNAKTEMDMDIHAFDGGFASANSFSSFSLAAGANLSAVMTRFNQDLIGVSATPILGTLPPTVNLKPSVFFGPTNDLIRKSLPLGINATIDSNQLKVLALTDALLFTGAQIFVIESASGLIGIPVRSGSMINVKMMFEPRLTLGQLVRLNSTENPLFNGDYKIMGLSHRGIISDSTGGECITEVNLWYGNKGLTIINVPGAS